MIGSKSDIECRLFLKLGFPVIVASAPEKRRTVRIYSTATGNDLAALNEAASELLPAHSTFRTNNPESLLVDFIVTSRKARELVNECRKWRRIAYVAPLFGVALEILAQIIWTVTP